MSQRNPMGFHRPHARVQKSFEGPGRTKQSFKKECDINEILHQFRKTGMIRHVAKRQGYYGDFIKAPTYHAALNLIHEAQVMFMELPAQVRAEFDNDPAKFLDFVHNEENEDAMREMGLLDKVTEEPVEAKNVEPVAAPKEKAEAVSEAIEQASE